MIDIERIKERARMMRPLFLPLIFYIGLLTLAVSWAPNTEGLSATLRYVIALLPMIPGALIALGVVRISAQLDEMERRILLESAAFSFILTLLLLLSLGLLGLVGGPQIGSAQIVLIMCVLLVVGKFLGNWRYR